MNSNSRKDNVRRLRRLSTEDEDTDDSNSWMVQTSQNVGSGSVAATVNSTRLRGRGLIEPKRLDHQRSEPQSSPAVRARRTTARAARRNPIVEVSTDADDGEEEEDDEDGEEDEEEDEEVDASEEEENSSDPEADNDEDAEGETDEEMPDATESKRNGPRASDSIKSVQTRLLSSKGHTRSHSNNRGPSRTAVSKLTPSFPHGAQPEIQNAKDADEDELSSLDSLEEDSDEDSDLTGNTAHRLGKQQIKHHTRFKIGGNGSEEDNDKDPNSEEASDNEDARGDYNRQTRRQRADYDGDQLIALSNEAQKKKHLTAEEHAMRRAELARRRKNLSEKRNEEEQLDTINRLLYKQEPKKKKKDMDDTENMDENGRMKPAPAFVRYVMSKQGTTLLVPEEWIGAPSGELLKRSTAKPLFIPPGKFRMVQELD